MSICDPSREPVSACSHRGLLPNWVSSGGFTILLGVQGEQHILAVAAAASSSKQQQATARKIFWGTSRLKIGIQVGQMTAEQMRIMANKFHAILSRLARSMTYLVSKNGRFQPVFKTIVLKPVGHEGICNQFGSSFRAIGLSNDCKGVFNEASMRHLLCRGAMQARSENEPFF